MFHLYVLFHNSLYLWIDAETGKIEQNDFVSSPSMMLFSKLKFSYISSKQQPALMWKTNIGVNEWI